MAPPAPNDAGIDRAGIDRVIALELYRTMRTIRRFEEECVRLVDANEIAAVVHESIGQEACAAGVCAALGPDDVITSTHRGHGHVLARGADPARMMAELMGRTNGLNRGRGGSMHVADVSLGILGANGIVAAGTPMAVGAVWALRTDGKPSVGAAFFGDGGINQGVLHEAMNMAAIWDVPVIFVCENNQYAVSTALDAMTKVPIAERASGYGMPVISVDGMDPAAVMAATRTAVELGRAGGGPSFVELRTYRYGGHHSAEAATGVDYRAEDELERWRAIDPVMTWPARLIALGWLDAGAKTALDAEVEAAISAAIEFGRAGEWPEADQAVELVYASGRRPGFPALGWEDEA